MKITIFLITGIILSMDALAKPDEKLIESMLFIVSPANEDLSSYEKVISVSKCALEKAQLLWERSRYQKFSNDILGYGISVESAVKSSNGLLIGKIPEKSESLVQGLKNISPYISECEEKFDIRVEF